jgi:hypothetical protein
VSPGIRIEEAIDKIKRRVSLVRHPRMLSLDRAG